MKVDVVELGSFLAESNRIEGIHHVTSEEHLVAIEVLAEPKLTVDLVGYYVLATANAELREHRGMDVRVGDYTAPYGGPRIRIRLAVLLEAATNQRMSPYKIHQSYEALHPYMDGNGRSGRLVWAWQMLWGRHSPGLKLGFLHCWYYQSLREGS